MIWSAATTSPEAVHTTKGEHRMPDDTNQFDFPSNPTRRERMLFEEHAGITFTELGAILVDPARHVEVSAKIEAALILIAVRRKIPTATINDVIDHDEWTLAPAAEEPAPGPLPKPTSTS